MGDQPVFRRTGFDSSLAVGKGLEAVTDYIVPLILFSIAAFAIGKGENAYDIMLQGASQGLRLLVSIVPSLILLLTAVHMLRASGAMDLLSNFLSPALSLFGIPPETAMLVLIRPISGSAALAVGAELMAEYGVDSQIGRTVAVMLGSTETTFYTISVYFGAAGIQKTRYTVPAALFADFVGFFMASWTVRLLYA
jgi:spore maturation protein B